MVIMDGSFARTWSTIPWTALFTFRTFTARPMRTSVSASWATRTDWA